jgi:hypothetical protein
MAIALGGLIAMLRQASPDERAAIYQELCLRLDYDPHPHQIKASADSAPVAGGVGGASATSSTRLPGAVRMSPRECRVQRRACTTTVTRSATQ